MENRNNIFEFATKELSQDAVICWLLNWINYPDSPLFLLAKDMFSLIGQRNINTNQKISIHTQVNNADIIVVLHEDRRIIIIEDKVYSTEHDNQIRKYRDLFSKEENQRILEICDEAPYEDIQTVYFKTGFYYDEDKLVEADHKVNGYDFLDIISKDEYAGKSEILDSYVVHLKEMLEWYIHHGDYTIQYPDGDWYVSRDYIAQHNLMRFFFSEDEWWDKDKNVFKVCNGSSFGRPWTQTDVCSIVYPNTNDKYYIFWRIDTSNKGPYLSFRMYEDYDRSNDHKKKRHSSTYDILVGKCKDLIDKSVDRICFTWDDVRETRYGGNYKESPIFTISLSYYLEKWTLKGKGLGESVRTFTREFLSEI